MPGLYTGLVSSVLFPLHERFKGHATVGVRRALEESQWRSEGEIEKLRIARLRELLMCSSLHVPYYQRVFKEYGFDPAKVASIADLQELPFLTKEVVRSNTNDLRAANATGLSRFNTGGSSGEPLVFYIGKERVSHDVAAKLRATRWWGVDIGDPEIVVWGSPIELGSQDRLRAIRDRIMRTQLLPAFEMSEEKLDSFVSAIQRKRPRMLFGYPSALSHIAQHANERGIRLDQAGIKVAFVTAEVLYDSQRTQIERTFGCRVANGYGGRDAGFLAHECPSGGMHVTAEDVIIEIVNEKGGVVPPGKAGEVVVTHLATKDYPFIRYKTGDMAVLDDRLCECGRGLPLIKEIQGRSTDFVVAMDGTILHGLALVYVVRDLPGIKQFKIEQESLVRTKVYVIPGEGFSPGTQQIIQAGIQARLGTTVDVNVELVAEIPKERSGKFRYIVSHVKPGPGRESLVT
jgi:phenylacetate-CoA ligase